ncbi:KH domain-containing protein / zinc finger (CCCHtype) family protein [Striga asiatica]|uniref:KH domain-containing protein / zinc finger (CCCHtype) family protein n=1 Tax=Striga asiatica TaxID=4170 RepID=A0A5A7Q2N4_STRAF|nr:KH domain-containing protein / zinc finger (CCCHtype) family protein [Striga asiatica]
MSFARKRGRLDAVFSGNGGFKRSKEELDSFTTGVGSKSKPCTKFFSTSGCTFGDTCHFLHYFPGYSAHTQLANSVGENPHNTLPRNSSFSNDPPSATKTNICKRINTPSGCRYGDRCHFSHASAELSGPHNLQGPHINFGVSATAKISVDANFAGAIIGKNGANTRQICQETGVKLSIREHESDPSKRNIELEGTFDQIKEASGMVRELLVNVTAAANGSRVVGREVGPRSFKKKVCEKFSRGLCTFGERCHFAHSA